MTRTPLGDVLVVDDIRSNVSMLAGLLQARGYNARTADSGPEAIEAARRQAPDLILLDIQMPEMDGFEVCTRLREDKATSTTPIIFISARDDIEGIVAAFNHGGVDFVSKPFEPEIVLARVATHIALRRLREDLELKNDHLTREIEQREHAEEALLAANHRLKQLASVDGLTQIWNRRSFDEGLSREWGRLRRSRRPLSLIMCDVDHFKAYNDAYGHQAGDECLRQIAAVIEAAAQRPADVAARYGGEEFVLLLPDVPSEGAVTLGKKILRELGARAIPHGASDVAGHVTLSLGLATTVPSGASDSGELVIAADRALYKAKGAGRNTLAVGEM